MEKLDVLEGDMVLDTFGRRLEVWEEAGAGKFVINCDRGRVSFQH